MAGRPRLTPTLTSLRSAISDGRTLLDVDGRSGWARRLRDLIHAHTSDLGGDGNLSEAERVLVRRAAMLTLQLELMEFNWAKNSEGEAGPKSIRVYQQCTNTLRRTRVARKRPDLRIGKGVTPRTNDLAGMRGSDPTMADGTASVIGCMPLRKSRTATVVPTLKP